MFDEITKSPDLHFKSGEKVISDKGAFMIVDVTACAWVNPPQKQIVLDIESVTCEQCIKRRKQYNGF